MVRSLAVQTLPDLIHLRAFAREARNMTSAVASVIPPGKNQHPLSKLRIGVILDSLDVPLWVERLFDDLAHLSTVEVVVLVKLNLAPEAHRQPLPTLLRAWQQLDKWLFRRRSMRPNTFDRANIRPESCRYLECNMVTAGAGLTLAASDCERIRCLDLDVLVRLSDAVPDTPFESMARFGIWSFEDDDELQRDLLRKILRREALIEHVVRVDMAATRALPCACSSMDPMSFFRNYSNVCWRRSASLTWALECLQQKKPDGFQQSLQPHSVVAPRPFSTVDTLCLIARTVSRLTVHAVRKGFLREHWLLAYRPRSFSMKASPDFHVLYPPTNHFYADPFLVERNGKTYVFFEDYSYKSRKGTISFTELHSDQGCSHPETVIEESYHLSYPCVFSHDNEIYLVPESKDNSRIQLYRAVDFPRHWVLDHVLLEDTRGVDPTLFLHEGKFWLFVSGLGTADPWFDGSNELFLFFSDSLHGSWTAHPRNPIVRDVRRCRPAGQLFWSSGQLIRPAQDYSRRDRYDVTLNRVDVLSTTDYRETPIASVSPRWDVEHRGTHTFNSTATYDVLDCNTLLSPLSPHRRFPMMKLVPGTIALVDALRHS